MRGRFAAGATVCFIAASGCAGPSTVETSVRDAFVDCMAEEGITIENVKVGVGDGRHIESFSWNSAEGQVAEEVGQRCEDAALSQFDVSRS